MNETTGTIPAMRPDATAQITIPKLDGETPRAYQARVRYLTLGERRSLDAVAQELAKSRSLIARWSERYGWYELAQQYDQALAALAARAHAEEYQRDLAAHRADAMRYGQALCAVAVEMLTQLRGVSKTIEYSPAALATIARALTTGLDLRAHALDLDKLIPTLTPTGANDE